jgi:CRP-like cAMP-binding protein
LSQTVDECEPLQPGQVVFRQGARGDKFYVVISGSVIVTAKAASDDVNFGATLDEDGVSKHAAVARKEVKKSHRAPADTGAETAAGAEAEAVPVVMAGDVAGAYTRPRFRST